MVQLYLLFEKQIANGGPDTGDSQRNYKIFYDSGRSFPISNTSWINKPKGNIFVLDMETNKGVNLLKMIELSGHSWNDKNDKNYIK